MFDPNFEVTFDELSQGWNAIYSPALFIIIAPLILLAFWQIVRPMLRKMRQLRSRRDKQQIAIMASGIVLILGWGFATVLTSIALIRISRPLYFAIGWLIWFAASQLNPFFLSITDSEPLALLVSDNTGHLFFSHEFETAEGYDAALVSALIQAINTMAISLFKSEKGVQSFDIGNKVVTSFETSGVYYHLLVTKESPTLASLLRYFASITVSKILEAHQFEYLDLSEDIVETFGRIQFISHHNNPSEPVPTLETS